MACLFATETTNTMVTTCMRSDNDLGVNCVMINLNIDNTCALVIMKYVC